MHYNEILNFWFHEIKPEQWFTPDAEFDALIRDRFSSIHQHASKGELFEWRTSPEGALAEIIILDQFSRNMFRGDAQAFDYDSMALTLAQNMVQHRQDKDLSDQMRSVLYLPYMHSESLKVHDEAIKLYTDLNLPEPLKFEKLHYDVIKKFGRYPHRNKILGRVSTKQEIEYLLENPNGF